ncbi:hypothetical protein [Dipodfec virus UOA04_Rod_819]|nr:hypothetical protein [Dipodfec virus UOA04_Rod_819]
MNWLLVLLRIYVRLIRLSRNFSVIDLTGQPPCIVNSFADFNELIEDIEEIINE